MVGGDGSIVFAGSQLDQGAAGYDALVVKLDKSGGLVWKKSFGGDGNDWAHDVVIYPGGGYAVAGWSDARGAKKIDAVVRRLNEAGDLIWKSRFGGDEIDRVYSISLTTDGGIGLAGVTHTDGVQGKDAWLVTIPRLQMPLDVAP